MKKWLSVLLALTLVMSLVPGAMAFTFGKKAEEIVEGAEQLAEQAAEEVKKTRFTFRKRAQEVEDEVKDAAEGVADEVKEAVGDVVEGVQEAVEGAVQEVLDGVEEALSDEDAPVAYIMYADGSWANQYWLDGNDYPVTAVTANVTGAGDYSVSLEFNEEAQGLAFAALGIKNGEKALPGHYIRINAIRVNGLDIAFTKGYTSSDDGVETRMNIYNEWVTDVPADARSYDGSVEGAAPIIVDKADFEAVKTVEVDFSVLKYAVDTAYIMYADSAWANQYWLDGNEYPVTVNNAEINGYGDYTVGLEFNEEAQGLAFAALGLKHGEKTYPGAFLQINAIRVNGEPVEFTKGFTTSDDGVETRMNIYNEWVSEVPAEARSADGSVEGAAAIIVDKEAFAAVKSVEVDFSLVPVTDTAYIMFADSAWATQYWLDGNEYPVQAENATVDGAGTYTVSLAFDAPANGIAFAALGVKTGEKTFPGYFIDIKSVKVNGEEVEVGKGYTASDDGVETRVNLYNEWVGEVPAEARRADGDLEGAAAIILSKDALAAVSSIEVTFDYIYGEAAKKDADAPMTEEDADALKAEGFKAYIAVQGKDTYVFRNAWNDNYGLNDEEHPYFYRLTGWDESNNAVDYGGTFVDADITADGEYTVSLTTGEMGFGETQAFNLLFVSTNIPSKLVADGFLTISDVRTKIGDARTQEYTSVDTSGEYVRLVVIDTYNTSSDPFGYTVPGPDTTIAITFTVSGMTK